MMEENQDYSRSDIHVTSCFSFPPFYFTIQGNLLVSFHSCFVSINFTGPSLVERYSAEKFFPTVTQILNNEQNDILFVNPKTLQQLISRWFLHLQHAMFYVCVVHGCASDSGLAIKLFRWYVLQQPHSCSVHWIIFKIYTHV